jgi:DNA (cytosine-5)-methyltransferase 1
LIKKRNRNEINGMAIQQENDGGLRELALFTGAGGGILGGKLLGWRTVCAVEWDAYAASVLVARQNDGCLPPFPVWDDVQTFDGRPWRGRVDVVSGGFPCQDISAAGKGAGIEGERSGMWKHMARIIGEVLPRFVFVENSPLLVGRGLGTVLADLAEMGYDAEWGIVGAHHAGAPHKRDRIWIVANSNRFRELQLKGMFCDERGRTCDCGGEKPFRYDKPYLRCRKCGCRTYEALADTASGESRFTSQRERREDFSGGSQEVAYVADADRGRQQQCDKGEWVISEPNEIRAWWESDPAEWQAKSRVGRVAHGVAARVDRLRAIGNGQVPSVVKLAWEILTENSDFS